MTAMLLITGAAFAQPQATLDVQPRVIRLNEQATLMLSLSGVPNPQPPNIDQLPNFQVQYVGQEQRFSMVNGRTSQTMTYRYRLVPQTSGEFTIGPFQLQAGGTTMDVQPVDIEVLSVSQQTTTRPADDKGQTIDELVFARISASKETIYNQEQFYLFIDLYVRGVNIDRRISLNNMPTTGLSVDTFQEMSATREQVNGNVYDVRHFRARATALTAGSFTFKPQLQVQIIVPRDQPQRQRDNFFGFEMFDQMFNRYETHPLSIEAEPMTIAVSALPDDGKPDSFSGAVGRFNLNVEASPLELKAGEPITITMDIAGEGSIDSVAKPSLALGDDFKSYEAKMIERNYDASRGVGHKVFEQVIIPRSTNIVEIPPVVFSYFNPEKEQYVSVSRGPYPLTVTASESQGLKLVQAEQDAGSSTIRQLGVDIVYLKSAPDAWSPAPTGAIRPGPRWLAIHTSPLLALLALVVWVRRREKLAGNTALARRIQAPRRARPALKAARDHIDDPAQVYANLWRALSAFMADRLNMDDGEITPSLILTTLKDAGLPDDQRHALENLLATGERIRFGGGGSPDTAGRLQDIDLTTQVLQFAERKVR